MIRGAPPRRSATPSRRDTGEPRPARSALSASACRRNAGNRSHERACIASCQHTSPRGSPAARGQREGSRDAFRAPGGQRCTCAGRTDSARLVGVAASQGLEPFRPGSHDPEQPVSGRQRSRRLLKNSWFSDNIRKRERVVANCSDAPDDSCLSSQPVLNKPPLVV